MYTVSELEQISGLTRRTIGDYIAKGLLAGPSHRGRGARYSQSDADMLRVIPRIRTLMKKEFPTLTTVREFLSLLPPHDLHSLAKKTNESAFELEVRTLRVQQALAAVLPQVPPEKLRVALKELTPEQIRGVDSGRYQLGAVVDMASLINEAEDDDSHLHRTSAGHGNSGQTKSGNGQEGGSVETHYPGGVNRVDDSPRATSNQSGAEGAGMAALESITKRLENIVSDSDLDLVRHESTNDSGLYAQVSADASATADRIADIAERVERLERLLETK